MWLVLLTGAAALTLPASLVAEEAAAERLPVQDLPSPATVAAVDALLADPRAANEEEAVRLARALGVSGGHAAMRGLATLVHRRETSVRVAALEAMAAVGLRLEAAAVGARRSLRATEPDVRGAALEALGRVGDGRDVPVLLEGLWAEDPRTRAGSLRALRGVTGMRLSASPARWVQWWSKAAETKRAEVVEALDALDDTGLGDRAPVPPDDADPSAVPAEPTMDPASARGVVQRWGWIDVVTVRTTAQAWIAGADHVARGEGYAIATALRLADLAPMVERGLRFASDEDAWAAADAARALGVAFDEEPPAED